MLLFQFTPLREGRQRYHHSEAFFPYISIHAPARGATRLHILIGFFRLFQFTPLREGRLCVQIVEGTDSLFQFTPLREGRP